MKKIILVLMMAFLSTSASANLEKQVDALTPEQAYRVFQKLQAKMLDPVPTSFFTKMVFTVSGGTSLAKLSALEDTIHPKFDGEFKRMAFVQSSLLWRLSDRFRLGLGGNILFRRVSKEAETSNFQTARILGMLFQVQAAYVFRPSSDWLISPLVGVGGAVVRGVVKTSSDSTTTSTGILLTHEKEFSGRSFSATGAISFLYRLNPLFSLGLNGGYNHAKITKLKRSGETEIESPADIDLSGALIGVMLAVNL